MSSDQRAPELPPLGRRLAKAFAAPRAQRAALIPYVTGGHPDLETSSRVIGALIDAGADIVELGIPFSDPIADGPVVQRSTHEALLSGVTPDDVLQLAAAHSGSAPFVILTYVNTVLAFGPERFFARAAASGAEARRLSPPRPAASPRWPPPTASRSSPWPRPPARTTGSTWSPRQPRASSTASP